VLSTATHAVADVHDTEAAVGLDGPGVDQGSADEVHVGAAAPAMPDAVSATQMSAVASIHRDEWEVLRTSIVTLTPNFCLPAHRRRCQQKDCTDHWIALRHSRPLSEFD